MVDNFSVLNGLMGGTLVGLAAVMLFAGIGRIAGISGIVAGLLSSGSDLFWKLAFVSGLIVSGFGYQWLNGPIQIQVNQQWPLLIVAGLLVGFGTRIGNGCTSGHGVCGTARFSKRSIAATLTFIVAGIVTVLIAGQV